MAAKSNPNMFQKLTEKREEEQQELEKNLTKEPPKRPVGRPKKRPDCRTIALTISAEDKQLVQDYAYSHCLSVSDVFHMWITEKCRN